MREALGAEEAQKYVVDDWELTAIPAPVASRWRVALLPPTTLKNGL